MDEIEVGGKIKEKDIAALFEVQSGNTIITLPEFNTEFYELIAGNEKAILKKLSMLLEFMRTSSPDVIYHHRQIEQLKYTESNMCALHLEVGGKNLRLLFVAQENGKIMLCAFYKRSGKRATDYDKFIKIAEDRLTRYRNERYRDERNTRIL